MKNKNPLRFSAAWDPVSMSYYNSRVTYKAPDINLYFAKNAAKLYTDPNLEHIVKTVKSGFPDPLLGQHSMKNTYSHPSSAKKNIEAGSKMVAAGNTMGTAVLLNTSSQLYINGLYC